MAGREYGARGCDDCRMAPRSQFSQRLCACLALVAATVTAGCGAAHRPPPATVRETATVVGPTTAAAPDPTPAPGWWFALQHRLMHALAGDYVCTLVAHDQERIVYVRQRSAVSVAHRTIETIPGAQSTTEVRVGDPQRPQAELNALQERLSAAIAAAHLEDGGDASIGGDPRSGDCRRVSIGVVDRGDGPNQAVVLWARRMVARHGFKRVVIEPIDPQGT
jgi:hypothetical protein